MSSPKSLQKYSAFQLPRAWRCPCVAFGPVEPDFLWLGESLFYCTYMAGDSVDHEAQSLHVSPKWMVSSYVNLVLRKEQTNQSEGVRAGDLVPFCELNVRLSSWLFLREVPLSQLTGLGTNGLQTPVFTQYIRSKWNVCAAAKSRKWWLGVTFGGEDALKQTLGSQRGLEAETLTWGLLRHLVHEAHTVSLLPGNSQGWGMSHMLQTSGMLLRALLSIS